MRTRSFFQSLVLLLSACARAAILTLNGGGGNSLTLSGGGVDVMAARGSTPSTGLYTIDPAYSTWWERFNASLRADIAPLCGNGRLDTLADYRAYYAALSAPTNSSATIYYIREACDDGNRLDGDGCAADCASFDMLSAPCPLALPFLTDAEPIEHAAVLDDGSVLALTSARVLQLDAATLAIVAVLDPAKRFAAHSAFFVRERQALYAYDDGTRSFWRLQGSRLWRPELWLANASSASSGGGGGGGSNNAAQAGGGGAVWAPMLDDSNDNGTLLGLFALLPDMTLVDVLAPRAFFPTTTPGAPLPVTLFGPMRVTDTSFRAMYQLMDTSGGELNWFTDTGRLDILPTPMSDIDVVRMWAVFLAQSMSLQGRLTSPYNGAPAVRWSKPLPASEGGGERRSLDTDTVVVASPYALYAETDSVRRDALPFSQSMVGFGDPLLRDASQHPEVLQCTVGNLFDRGCALDLSTCYDAFGRPPPAASSISLSITLSAAPSAFEALQQAAAAFVPHGNHTQQTITELLAAGLSRTDAIARGQCPGRAHIQQVLMHPLTGAVWLLRNGTLLEASRRGSQVRVVMANGSSSTCLPAFGGACSAGQWAPPRLGCRACSEAPSDSAPRAETIAHAQGCPSSPQPQRRLLQQQQAGSSSSIELTLLSRTLATADAATAFFQSSIGGTSTTTTTCVASAGAWRMPRWTYAYDCVILIISPTTTTGSLPAVQRALAALVSADNAYLSAPMAVLHASLPLLAAAPSPPSAADSSSTAAGSTTSTSTVVAVVAGGVAGAAALVGLGVAVYGCSSMGSAAGGGYAAVAASA